MKHWYDVKNVLIYIYVNVTHFQGPHLCCSTSYAMAAFTFMLGACILNIIINGSLGSPECPPHVAHLMMDEWANIGPTMEERIAYGTDVHKMYVSHVELIS